MKMVDTGLFKNVDNKLKKKIMFFFSMGSKDMKQVTKWCKVLKENLKKANLSSITWDSFIFEGCDHNTSDLKALQEGLRFLNQ